MTDKVQKIREKAERLRNLHQIKYQHLDTNDNMCLVECGKRNLCNELLSFIDSLQEEPVSEDLEEACEQLAENARKHKAETSSPFFSQTDYKQGVIDGAKWKVENIWKPADGDDLPEIDREVIVLCKNGRVAFGHRPVEKFKARPIGYGRTEEYEVKTYGKGGWNIPNVKYWLDCSMPNLKKD